MEVSKISTHRKVFEGGTGALFRVSSGTTLKIAQVADSPAGNACVLLVGSGTQVPEQPSSCTHGNYA